MMECTTESYCNILATHLQVVADISLTADDVNISRCRYNEQGNQCDIFRKTNQGMERNIIQL